MKRKSPLMPWRHWMVGIVILIVLSILNFPAQAQSRLAGFMDELPLNEVFPDAERLGPIAGEPPAATAYKGNQLLGYVFLSTDVRASIGYSGKPIHMAIGLDTDGKIVGVKLLEHSEPIVLIGIPERRMVEFIDGYVGMNVLDRTAVAGRAVDAISGATVTVMVIDDVITRAALKVARSRGLGEEGPPPEQVTPVGGQMDMTQTGTADWETLLDEGSVARLHLTIGEVNQAFERLGGEAAERPEPGEAGDTFIDLYVALASAPVIGRSLLGEREYQLLRQRLQPDQHAILIAGKGPYSWRGSGYVRGGIFDRIKLTQEDIGVRFRDRHYKRIGDLAAGGAPPMREIGLFLIPSEAGFYPARPWQLQLLVQRAIGALEKTFLTFEVEYTLPDKYLQPAQISPPSAEAPAPAQPAEIEVPEEPLWQRIWRDRVPDVAILLIGLLVLTVIFFFQDALVKRPRLTDWVRIGFLSFTLFWLGWYANAQLSVVNVLTFTNSLLTDFSWDYFLMDPLVFILWSSVAASLLFWGRGPFCGWLCPFGALQEFVNRIAKLLKIPQITVPWGLHERIWPLKYIIFLGLFGFSLYSLAWAERFSEVEPFKTAIILNFIRDWPFVVYAVALLVVGLFIERFFCRYLCPLGAALAIPGRIRMFEWLKRYKECGRPCQRCANECMVQAIHPEGHINPNECIYCLHCQTLYYDDHRCPVMIQKRLKREKASALASKSPSSTPTGGNPHGK